MKISFKTEDSKLALLILLSPFATVVFAALCWLFEV